MLQILVGEESFMFPMHHYWTHEDSEGKGIAFKEAKAIFKTLSTFSEEVFNSRVDAWNNEGRRNCLIFESVCIIRYVILTLLLSLPIVRMRKKAHDHQLQKWRYKNFCM